MAKRCGFCDFSTEDEAEFAAHMRATHSWGAPAGLPSPMAGTAHIAAAGEPGLAKFCGNCGAARDSLSTNFCRNCGASFVTTSAPAQPVSLAFAPKGGFGIRALAYLLDIIATAIIGGAAGIVLGIVAYAAKMPQGQINSIANVVGGVIGVAYFLYCWSKYGHGQTLGMRALKLRVVRTDGSDISVPRAFLRWIGINLSALAVGIGLIWAAFDRDKQGWHDKLADTYVVRVG